ncbi:hypothetical protein GCM10012275_16090 [Longimycelium tulufanense]|uniref:Hint domain-containing protein n=1 Tax=Longimycelium tulufanense TaxID=907463 RepID=A0A8J3C721_9PSEU|nr:hypothetical protein GCM10012275_16090 [Longimycelium tulufanense]
MRSQFPLWTGEQPPTPANHAEVADAPTREPTFDPGTSVELPERRSSHERVYRNEDGTETTEFATAPLNYRTRDGTWEPIDSRLVPAADGWRNAADAVEIRLAGQAKVKELVRLGFDDSRAAGFGLAGAAAVAGNADGDTVTYPDVLGGVDLKVQAQGGGVKETLVLRSPDVPHSYVFPLSLSGLEAKIVGGQVELVDSSGRQRAVIPSGFMWDAKPDAEVSNGVSYRIVSRDGGPALEVRLDSSWLRDPERRYPVMVDPSVDSAGADSSMVVHGNSSRSGSSELLVGRKGGAASASYLKFNKLVGRLRHHTIYGAQLHLVNFDSASCRARPVTVHPVTQSWSVGSNYSYPGPSVGRSLASKSFAYGYIRTGQSRSACPAKGTLFNLGVSGRKVVQGWVDGKPNNGLSLRASASDSNAWKRIAGSGTANPPKLFVTHSPYNASYRIPNPVPEPPVLQNQSGKVKVTVTNRSAEKWTRRNYYLAYRVYDAKTGRSVTQQRSASLPGDIDRNAKVTLTAEIKPLPPGKYFVDFTMVRSGGVVFTDQQVPPARIVLEVIDIPPVVEKLHPPNGYQAQTLTPQLWARAIDIDAPPGSQLKYRFEVCKSDDNGKPVNCFRSDYQNSPAWTVPAEKLVWSRNYLWRAFVKDATTEVPSPQSTLVTAVPQPALTSRIAGAPYGSGDKEFDPQVGNFTTVAVDAPVVTVGPELSVVRTYNSLDPRRESLFGTGWTTRYDMRLAPDDDGSGNVVIRYPDGQEVRFGKNPDGSFAPPQGRTASLGLEGANWKLLDKSGMAYHFASSGRLTKITDAALRSLVLTYGTDGKLAKATVSNSQTNKSGRSLRFEWSGAHVAKVTTDPVDGSPLSWTYHYEGDLLTKVCTPGGACTTYTYGSGSHYRSAVLDDRPESYHRLGEAQGDHGGSEVAVNLGKDRGEYKNVALGAPGAIAEADDTAASFNGTSSLVDLPKGTLKKNRDASVELWFKNNITGSGGPLIGYQDKALDQTSGSGIPILYVGNDGKLRGQFANGSIAPITSTARVNDGKWHHAVLTARGDTQTLYLDGKAVGTVRGKYADLSALTFNQVGAAYATGSWPAWGSGPRWFYSGTIDEVAVYAHPLGPGAVAAHHQQGLHKADQLTEVTLPSGRTVARVEYDVRLDRVREYTDRNGGTWKIGAPIVYGGDTDLRRSIEVRDPADRFHLYEYDALAGRMIRSAAPTGLGMREEDRPGEPSPSPTPTTTPTCTEPDPGDPKFCTTVPDSSKGPVFDGHSLDGMSVRTFSYDDQGFQNLITDENGASVHLTYDKRGNVTSRKTCRTKEKCYTEYYTYPAEPVDPFDPRSDMPTEHRDGRSDGPNDNRFRTIYTYSRTGELATQTNPDGGIVRHTYSTGSEPAVDGGATPPGLVLQTTDPRGAQTKYRYYQNGDLAQVTEPSGLVTKFSYDALGRKTKETAVSDSYPDGATTTYTYDGLSRLTSVTKPATTDAVNGTKHQAKSTNGYDADGNVIRVEETDALAGGDARVTSFEYDDHGRVQRQVDAEGNETSFGYDRFGNKTSMIDAEGNRYEYGYTARNKIAEVRLWDFKSDAPAEGDEPEYLVLNSYAYDFAGRMVRHTDAMGRRLEYRYYDDDKLQSVTLKDFRNLDGSKRDYVVESNSYDGAGNLIKQVAGNGSVVTEHRIDRAGRVESTVVDPGGLARRTDFRYDHNGNVLRVSHSGKASNVPWPVSTNAETVDYVYDAAGNVTKETVVAGASNLVTSRTYDQRGLRTSTTDPRGNLDGADKSAFTTTFRYDELGRQVSAVGPTVSAESGGQEPKTVEPTRRFGYNAFDEQVAVKDELGNVSRVSYDKLSRPVTSTAPSYKPPGTSDPITPTTRTRYDGLGNATEVIDPRGNTTRYTYDRLGRMIVRDEPSATNDERAVWRYTYTHTGEVLSVTDPTGARAEATYDDLDRKITSTRVERHPVADNYTTRYEYDDAGNLTAAITPSGAKTTYTYDAVGELIKSTDAAGTPTHYGYDFRGRQVRIADALGRTSRQDFDPLGRMTSESDLNPAGETLRTQKYGYDHTGNLTSSTDPYGRPTKYEYDAANQLVRQTEPVSDSESITTSFGYDAAGNRTRYTDGRGNSTLYTVNSLGLAESVIEPVTAKHPKAEDRTWTVAYDATANPVKMTAPGGVKRLRTFDAAGRMTSEKGEGAEKPTADRTFGYNLRGDLITVNAPKDTNKYVYDDRGNILSADGPSGKAGFEYNVDGQLTGRTDAAGKASYAYRNARLDTVTDSLTSTVQRLGYDGAGQPKTIDYGSGRVRTFGYDDIGRMASDKLVNATGNAVASIEYGYDENDHLTRKNTLGTAGAGENTYGYDQAGRLTSWTAEGKTTEYHWDASGNRVRAGDKEASFDERNRLRSDGDYTYDYTPRGTLASRTSSGLTEPFSFDAFDRLIAQGGTAYEYDGLDRLVSRNGTAFSYAGTSDEVVSDGVARYARGPADELLAVEQDGTRRLTLSDEHEDLVAGFDPADTALASLPDSTAYDPFGKVIAKQGERRNIGYQGDWTDQDSGQVKMGARWYDPGTGRFNSRDEVDYVAGESILANRYVYGAGAPLDYTDPDGQWPSCGWCKKVVNKAASVVKSSARAVYNGVRKAASWAWSGVKKVARKIASAARWVYHKARAAVRWVGNKVRAAARWVGSKVSAAVNWAKKRAAAARKAAIRAAKAVTRKAKRAAAWVAKHNPIRVIKAAIKPLYAGIKKVVSAAAHLPARVVATVRDVVADATKAVKVIYKKAVEAAGTVVETVSKATQAVSEFVQTHKAAIAGFVAGAVVGVGCGVAIGWTGVGAVACGALAGAVGSVVHDVVEGGHSLREIAGNALLGGVLGGLTGGLGAVAGQALRAGVGALGAGFRSAGQSALGAARAEAGNIVRGRMSGGVTSRLGGCNSFTASTSVLMADGTRKAIQDVRVGDMVLATDPTTGRTEAKPVTNLITGEGDKTIVEVVVDVDGDKGDATAKIEATDQHPFWVDDQGRWVDAKDLRPGNLLRTSAGTYVQVVQTRTRSAYERVHNLTVDGVHTYYVAAEAPQAAAADTLVHNCRSIDPFEVRFTQDSAGKFFSSGNSVFELARDLKAGAVEAASIPPIRLVQNSGKLFSLDNRRLAAFQMADVPVPYRMATRREIAQKWDDHFTTETDGIGIAIRLGGGREVWWRGTRG